ncbi:hypothetical protein CROQUDRAFT_524490 [Cronartium quercuum f. sp. fusiforme G11]|uniref:Uncharacterized protein n=1 Tax=Cronartium quercuum f. sp. fusiforme G11 TaxID=708437 RepID=A0A9P6NG87_9BASI|nr:hypothetical protein CROQUDRAFT_524490 [Cronartium quercuum f. sp. fusiforme G11]
MTRNRIVGTDPTPSPTLYHAHIPDLSSVNRNNEGHKLRETPTNGPDPSGALPKSGSRGDMTPTRQRIRWKYFSLPVTQPPRLPGMPLDDALSATMLDKTSLNAARTNPLLSFARTSQLPQVEQPLNKHQSYETKPGKETMPALWQRLADVRSQELTRMPKKAKFPPSDPPPASIHGSRHVDPILSLQNPQMLGPYQPAIGPNSQERPQMHVQQLDSEHRSGSQSFAHQSTNANVMTREISSPSESPRKKAKSRRS